MKELKLSGFGRMIKKDEWHIGWFKDDVPHGWGIGNMFIQKYEGGTFSPA